MNVVQQIETRPMTKRQWELVALGVVANVAEYFDLFLIGFVVALLTKPWHLTGLEAGIILTCSGFGTVLGSWLGGMVADRVGRKRTFSYCVLTFVGFTALSLLTPERGWQMLALSRIGVGAGVAALNITTIPYVQEFMPRAKRGMFTGLVSVFIPAGLFLGAAAQRFFSDSLGWRGLIALGIIPVFLLLWIARVPESPRFLLAAGRGREAQEAYAWAMELPVSKLAPLPANAEGKQISTLAQASKPDPVLSLGEFFRGYWRPYLVVATGSFCFILGVFTVQSWGQSLLSEAFGYSTVMVGTMFMWISVADIAGRAFSAWICDYIGRKRTMLIYGLLGGLGAFICAISAMRAAAGAHGQGAWFYAGLVLILAFGDGAFGIVNLFGAEQFPTPVRGRGLGLGYGTGAIAKIIGPALVGLLLGPAALHGEISLSAVVPALWVFGVLLVLGGLIYQFATETARDPLS
ncbi:MFS transporter [Boudabousia tangfeifanii]|uniref:MFS transporter n=2 Tax=Boudabousia tangfeifanii TaxID=1912795 RepID=A0A1D9MMV2_9ACTO|nr:MFS transporter [Boudabousia tangfeifanii]AOZ73578.1 MFS transporter [Boudabousia tangfeifanii]